MLDGETKCFIYTLADERCYLILVASNDLI